VHYLAGDSDGIEFALRQDGLERRAVELASSASAVVVASLVTADRLPVG
jgi:hypothetical protein